MLLMDPDNLRATRSVGEDELWPSVAMSVAMDHEAEGVG